MTLENKDILQVDATVITGILIFLGVSFVTVPPPADANSGSSDYFSLILKELGTRVLLTLSLLAPFVISALIILVDEIIIETFRGRRTRITGKLKLYALIVSASGFVLLFFQLGGLLYVIFKNS